MSATSRPWHQPTPGLLDLRELARLKRTPHAYQQAAVVQATRVNWTSREACTFAFLAWVRDALAPAHEGDQPWWRRKEGTEDGDGPNARTPQSAKPGGTTDRGA